jgi:hypothetical protein|tara:strand:+ start:193 stop:621 length:429 start_codon:yes stop_codon:yes gene_type:complete
MVIHAQEMVDTVLLAPQGITDGATVTVNYDTRGAKYATIRLNFASEETTHATDSTVSVLESDDTVVTNFATIVADQATDLVAAKELRYEIDLKGRKRYLRLSVSAGTTTGGNITVGSIGSLSRNDIAPVSTTAMGDDTVVIV